ncbi:MAG TPA: ABC transporter transmembrane domain-containing protein, partial [Hyphomicrobiaceae bacterium]|nr:ABC transporter transmembrane domain-containing protein [Hyphomicrobiaceae bacterium]
MTEREAKSPKIEILSSGSSKDVSGLSSRVRISRNNSTNSSTEKVSTAATWSDDEAEAGLDVLASAIADIAAHFGQRIPLATLTSGLSLVQGRLPREYAADAALRAGLAATVLHADSLSLADYALPVIVFTREGEVEIVWSVGRDAAGKAVSARMSLPGNPEAQVDVPASDLKSVATGELLQLRPVAGTDKRGEEAISTVDRNWFLEAFRDSRAIYAEAILATVAINILALAMPLFSMNVYDRVLPNAAEATLWALAIGVMLAIAFDFLIRTLRALFVDAASRKADVRLSALIYSRLLGARLSAEPASAGVRSNTLREFETLRDFFNSATLTAFGELPFLVLFLVVIWIVAGPLVFVVAASIPIILLAGWLTQRSLQKLMLTAFQGAAQKNAVVVETVVGLESIKAAGGESWAAQKWERSVAEHVRIGLKIRHVSNLGQHFVQGLQTLVQLAVVIVGFYLVSAGQITMGALIAATILSGRALA